MRFIIIYSLTFCLLLLSCKSEERKQPIDYPTIDIFLESKRVVAGHELLFRFRSQAYIEGQVVFEGVWGQLVQDKILQKGDNDIIISPAINTKTGLASIYFTSDTFRTERVYVEILPGPSASAIPIYTGPKSIWIDGIQRSMIAAIPIDTFGNALADQTKVRFNSRTINSKTLRANEKSKHMIAPYTFYSDKKANDYLVGVSGDGFQAMEQTVSSVPFLPRTLLLDLVQHIPYADDRQFTSLRTRPIRDRAGNVLPDGTLIEFYIHSDKGTISKYKSFTIDGVASVSIKNPSYETVWEIKASLAASYFSNTIKLFYGKAIKDLRYSFDSSSKILTVGPLISYLGQLVSNETQVYCNGSFGTLQEGTEKGKAIFELKDYFRDGEGINIKIMVGDHEKELRLK